MRWVHATGLKTRLLLLIGVIVVGTSLVVGIVGYHRQRSSLLAGIDEKLAAAARLASLVPPMGYYDRIVGEDSVAPAEYERLVARNNALCEELDLQYLWSVMVVDGRVVFTTSTSPGHDAAQQDHAKFFEEHRDPHAFDHVFATMKPDYSSFHNEWGDGRMVLVPAVDANGRKLAYGASMSTEKVDSILLRSLLMTGLTSLVILAAGLLLAWYVASRLTRPIVRLTEVSAAIARGELDAAGDDPTALTGGTRSREMVTLSRSIVAMGQAIREHIQAIEERETNLRHSRKMEAVGQLAGGIAHDLNNMLGGITGSTEVLRSLVGEDPKAARFLKLVDESADRAADLVSKLLTFARKGQVESRPVNLHGVVRSAVALLERSIDKRIRVRTELTAARFVVVADPSQLESAILNLGINARDAMPDGGELVLHTENVDMSDDECQALGFEKSQASCVHLSVRDTGCGMDEETQKRMFEPFFTTKDVGKGTGLGLPAVYGAVRDHGGAIRVESTVGQGTTFHIYLPTSELAVSEDPGRSLEPDKGSGTVLVVDDEEVIRAMSRGLLEHLGYRVLLASDGMEALEVYRRHRDRIDLVLLDSVMPRMGGRACLEALVEMDPDVRVLITSGFIGDAVAGDFEAVGARGFLKKPYDGAGLSQAIARVLS